MTNVQPSGAIHAAANVFPMLPEDELAELAADIKANGLIHPIVLDKDGTLVDGRNREAACRLAGVEPRYESLNGHDPVTFVLSANVNRRNLTKGQRAMAVARMNRMTTKLSLREVANRHDVNRERVRQADAVLDHAEELADAVMAGTVPLNEAYAEARQRKEAKESREEQLRRAERELAALRTAAPDLADLVTDERVSLREAMAVQREREELERENRTRHTKMLWTYLVGLYTSLRSPDPARMLDEWLPGVHGLQGMAGTEHLRTAEGLHDLAQALEQFARGVAERGGCLE